MATKAKRTATTPRYPERKWGPFHGGVGVAVWLNEIQTDAGPSIFRTVTVQPRRYRDKKTGIWKDAGSLRPTDLSALMLAMDAALFFIAHTPLPGQPRRTTTRTKSMPSPTRKCRPKQRHRFEPFLLRPLSKTPMFGAWGYFDVQSWAGVFAFFPWDFRGLGVVSSFGYNAEFMLGWAW